MVLTCLRQPEQTSAAIAPKIVLEYIFDGLSRRYLLAEPRRKKGKKDSCFGSHHLVGFSGDQFLRRSLESKYLDSIAARNLMGC